MNIVKGDNFDSELALILFDTSVHSGVARASKILQEVLNFIKNTNLLVVDGKIGRLTIAEYKSFIDIYDIKTLLRMWRYQSGIIVMV